MPHRSNMPKLRAPTMERAGSAQPGLAVSISDLEEEQPAGCWPRFVRKSRSVHQLLVHAPWVWIIPLAVLAVLLVVSEVAIYVASQSNVETNKQQAASVLETKLSGIDSTLLSMQGPLAALSSVIEQDPDMRKINSKFPQVSDHIIKSLGLQDVLFTIRVLPFSTISAVWPRTAADFATLNFQALTSPLYRDFTRGIIASRTDSIQLSGPLKLLTDESRGFALSMPKFLPSPNINETWGLDQPLPVAYAPPGACVGPNKERVDCVIGNVTNPYFDPDACGDVCKPRMVDGVQHVYWGTLTVTVRATVLLELLDTVSAFDYKYCLMRIEDFGTRNSNTSDGFTIGIDSSVIFPLVRLPSAARASASRRKAPRVRAHACAHHMAQRPLARAHACTPHGTASPCVRVCVHIAWHSPLLRACVRNVWHMSGS